MTFLTNLFLAVPTLGWAAMASLSFLFICVLLYEKRTQTSQKRVTQWLQNATLLTLALVLILVASSPKVWLSKESLESVDKLPNNSLELKLDDELRGAQEGVNRVPVPKQRDSFKHHLFKEKEIQ